MADLGEDFSAEQHGEMGQFEPAQKDKYYGQIIASERKVAKNPQNAYIELQVQMMGKGIEHGEETENRTIYVIINKWNTNPKAVEIANKELATIMRACQRPTVRNTDDLHNIPMILDVDIEPANNGYGPKNKILNYSPTGNGQQPAATQTQQQTIQQTQQTTQQETQIQQTTPQGATAEEKPPWA